MTDVAISLRERVYQFEKIALEQPQTEIPVTHHFSWGTYAREIRIPAGVLVTGKLHKYPQLNILLSGTIDLVTENGLKRLEAPQVICSPSGTKRAARAVTEVRWLTILPTHETDPEKIEQTFTADSEAEYQQFLEERGPQWLLSSQR